MDEALETLEALEMLRMRESELESMSANNALLVFGSAKML